MHKCHAFSTAGTFLRIVELGSATVEGHVIFLVKLYLWRGLFIKSYVTRSREDSQKFMIGEKHHHSLFSRGPDVE